MIELLEAGGKYPYRGIRPHVKQLVHRLANELLSVSQYEKPFAWVCKVEVFD